MSNQNNNSLRHIFLEWIKSHSITRRSFKHLEDFWYVWIILGALAIGLVLFSKSDWQYGRWLCRILLVTLTLLFVLRPMNAVYGLMGTRGSIRLFFLNFITICFFFAIIYYFGFFKYAGISYDVNQPHVAYDMYGKENRVPVSKTKLDIQIYLSSNENDVVRDTVYQETTINYQPINFSQVFQNTIMTSLIQEPTDLFAIASTFNAGMGEADTNVLINEKATMFHWVLIFQILISWIFFGVFISLLYNKFRYES